MTSQAGHFVSVRTVLEVGQPSFYASPAPEQEKDCWEIKEIEGKGLLAQSATTGEAKKFDLNTLVELVEPIQREN